jgi:hypothetical protein
LAVGDGSQDPYGTEEEHAAALDRVGIRVAPERVDDFRDEGVGVWVLQELLVLVTYALDDPVLQIVLGPLGDAHVGDDPEHHEAPPCECALKDGKLLHGSLLNVCQTAGRTQPILVASSSVRIVHRADPL